MNLPTPSPKVRILLIDDNPAIHSDFRKILCEETLSESSLAEAKRKLFDEPARMRGSKYFTIDSALQGEEGLELIKRAVEQGQPYAMAFIDVRMPPGLDGIETTEKAWDIDPDLQVVICTAYSDYSWVEMIEKVGESDQLLVLKKPFENIEALQLAHALTEKWQLLQQTRELIASLDQIANARKAESSEAHERVRVVEQDYADLLSIVHSPAARETT